MIWFKMYLLNLFSIWLLVKTVYSLENGVSYNSANGSILATAGNIYIYNTTYSGIIYYIYIIKTSNSATTIEALRLTN